MKVYILLDGLGEIVGVYATKKEAKKQMHSVLPECHISNSKIEEYEVIE